MTQGRPPSGFYAGLISNLREPGLFLGAGLAVALFLSMVLVPMFGVISGSLTPVPLVYHYYRRGPSFGLTMIGVALAVVFTLYSLTGRPFGGMVFLEYSALAAALGEGLRRGLSPSATVGAAAFTALALGGLVLAIGSYSQGKNPVSHGRDMIEQQVRISFSVYQALMTGQAPETQTDESIRSGRDGAITDPPPERDRTRDEVGERIIRTLLAIFPGLMIMGTLLIAWANFLAGRFFLARAKALSPEMENLRAWRAPEGLVWPLIAFGFGLAVFSGWIRVLSVNALMVLGLVYFFQGLCIISFWMEQKNVPPFFRVVAYAIIALQQYLALVISALGLFDMWLDFRKLKASGEDME